MFVIYIPVEIYHNYVLIKIVDVEWNIAQASILYKLVTAV